MKFNTYQNKVKTMLLCLYLNRFEIGNDGRLGVEGVVWHLYKTLAAFDRYFVKGEYFS